MSRDDDPREPTPDSERGAHVPDPAPVHRASGDPGPDGRPADAIPDDTSSDATSRPRAAARPQTLWPEGTRFGRADKICFGWLAFATVYNVALIPARPVLLGLQPVLLVALTGSRTGMVAAGAFAATGRGWWPLALVLGTLSLVKFHWIYWWAGKRFGNWFIAGLIGPGERAARRAQRAEAVTRRWDVFAMFVTFIPFVPFPAPVVYALLGASGTRLRRFLALDLGWALVLQSFYLALGWRLGEPAVQVLEQFAKYSWYLTGVLVVVIVVGAVRSARQEQAR